MINFEESKKLFDGYIKETYFKINEMFYDVNDEESIKRYNHRNDMIKQKYDHTMRVVENIYKMALKMGQSINFLELTKVVGLFHDVGRFEQVLYSDTYVDNLVYKDNPYIKNHGQEGEKFLNEKGFEIFSTPKNYKPVIGTTVGLHQENEIPNQFNQKVELDFAKTNPDMSLTGDYKFNEYEKKVISLLLQMIRDIDKIDILYQRANGEIKSVPEIMRVDNIGIKNLIETWGITINDLKELNSTEELENSSLIKIRTSKIPMEKLFIKEDIKKMIYNGENINLKELQNRPDYSFVTAIWWSIYTFLSGINFVSNLEVIEENNLLKQIYGMYPDEYKPLIDEIFIYAKEVLIEETINANKDNLYVNKNK